MQLDCFFIYRAARKTKFGVQLLMHTVTSAKFLNLFPKNNFWLTVTLSCLRKYLVNNIFSSDKQNCNATVEDNKSLQFVTAWLFVFQNLIRKPNILQKDVAKLYFTALLKSFKTTHGFQSRTVIIQWCQLLQSMT